MTSLTMCLPVAQWLEHTTDVQKVMGSILVGVSDFFVCPTLQHSKYSIFSYFLSKLKICHLSLFIILHHTFNSADPSSMQDACH